MSRSNHSTETGQPRTARETETSVPLVPREGLWEGQVAVVGETIIAGAVHGALRGYIEGTSDHSISDELRARHCTVVLHDARTAEIPPRDRAFIDAHFVQIKDIDASVYLPGQRYEAAELRNDGVEFNVVTPGRYRIRRGLTDSVTRVDQRAVEASVDLDAGPHLIESLGPPSALTIWRVPGQ